jgi:hypothetical protein
MSDGFSAGNWLLLVVFAVNGVCVGSITDHMILQNNNEWMPRVSMTRPRDRGHEDHQADDTATKSKRVPATLEADAQLPGSH